MDRMLFILFVVILTVFCNTCAGVFKQERGKVLYTNRKYIKSLTIFTYRENRNSPYLTSINFTTLVPFGNNTTVEFEFINPKLQAFPLGLELKLCDSLKTKWVKDWLQTYSDTPTECPFQPGDYHFTRFELPPKNFPIKFNNIDYILNCTFFMTGTKEKICELTMQLRFNRNG